MTLVVVQFISTYLTLLAAVICVNNGQNIASGSQNVDSYTFRTCGEDQFQCQNGECILSQLLCDGNADCSDSSDETEYQCRKPGLYCPPYAFRCQYGACIDRELVCDGNVDCVADGSDEDSWSTCSLPSTPLPDLEFNITRPFAVSTSPPQRPVPRVHCATPPVPVNGMYSVIETTSEGTIKYTDPPSTDRIPDGRLEYRCAPGFRLRGNAKVHCDKSGKWSRKPVCIEIRCRHLNSLSTNATCIHDTGKVKQCSDDLALPPKTLVHVSCRPSYAVDWESSIFRSDKVECDEKGEWTPVPVRCAPECGVVNTGRLKSPSNDNSTEMVNTFPWHALIYGVRVDFPCSATVIRSNLLLTAASCIYDKSALSDDTFNSSTKISELIKKLFVVTDNVRDDHASLSQGLDQSTKYWVRNVHTDCGYHLGSSNEHSNDIALVELQEHIEFTSNLLPACLDTTGFIQENLDTISGAVITGSGTVTTSTRRPASSTSKKRCTYLYNASRNPFFTGEQKFCNRSSSKERDAQYNNGGGLVYEVDRRWYLVGLLSRDISSRNPHSAYTRVSQSMRWIQQVISDLENYKYPPCSRYLPSFHVTTPKREVATETPTVTVATTPEPVKITTSTITTITTPMTRPVLSSSSMLTPGTDPVKPRSPSGKRGYFCFVPPQPAHGEWLLHRDFCDDDVDCPSLATTLGLGTQLVYKCNPGYQIEGNTEVYCRANGNWSSVPVCTEITCPALNSLSLIATCFRTGEWVDCDFPVYPGTHARLSCRPGYWAPTNHSETVACNIHGEWEPELATCEPGCGKTSHPSKPFVGNEITVHRDNFPWHATLYMMKKRSRSRTDTGHWVMEIQCGATLIQSNLLLTAAHCVYNKRIRTSEDPRRLAVLIGNIHRQYDSPLHNPQMVKRRGVKRVHIHCKYFGLEKDYASDIALLELDEPLELFNMQLYPACLDFSGYNAKVFGSSATGRVFGFGKTVTGALSDILQTITVPHVSDKQCRDSLSDEKKGFIAHDKFCAGYNNGTAVCMGNGGGGAYVQVKGLWYLVGIASADLSGDDLYGGNSCNGNAYTLYTQISEYMAWILDVAFHLDHYNSYPLCIRNPISSFSRFGEDTDKEVDVVVRESE